MSLFDVSQHMGYFKQIFKNLLRGLGTPRPFWPLPPPRLSQKPKFVLFFFKASLRGGVIVQKRKNLGKLLKGGEGLKNKQKVQISIRELWKLVYCIPYLALLGGIKHWKLSNISNLSTLIRAPTLHQALSPTMTARHSAGPSFPYLCLVITIIVVSGVVPQNSWNNKCGIRMEVILNTPDIL